MQRKSFDSFHIVMEHYKRQHGIYPPLMPSFKAEDCINDIRRHLDRLGIYVAGNEWPTFIERFCTFDIEGDISLDRKKFMFHKDVSDKAAAKILGDEIQQHPELLDKLRLILKGGKKTKQRGKVRHARAKPMDRPIETYWAS